MSQPIITTDISQIRPVFAQGAGENINRYKQLKTLFAEGKEYTVLAEPMLDGPNKITWHTEFEGTPSSFSNLTEEEQIAAKSIIKKQVNKLYKSVFRQVYRKDMNDVKALFDLIDSCIEIPDYDNIYRILQPNGEANFVLIKWGFNGNEFNAPTGLVKKLVPTKVDTVKLRVIKNQKPAIHEPITVCYNGKESSLTTFDNGYVYIHDFPLGDKFAAYVGDKEANLAEYLCNGSDDYTYLINTRKCDMNFVVRDAKGAPIPDAEISFTYDGRTYFETTDSNGRICLKDIPEGTEVSCRQKDKSKDFVCDYNCHEYEFEGVRYIAEIEVAVLTDRGEIVSGAEVRFEFAGKAISLGTDHNGRVTIDNMPPDTEIVIVCRHPEYQSVNTKLYTHEGLNMAEIKLRSLSQSGDMIVRAIDINNAPIVNSLVRCDYNGNKQEYTTNDNGEFVIAGVPYNSSVSCTQIVNGVGSHSKTFIFTDSNEVHILKGMRILSEITNLGIHVVNNNKEDIPNLRVSIDDGHNVINRITDGAGRISVDGLVQGKTYTISTDCNNKKFETRYVPRQPQEEYTITLGPSKFLHLLWIVPLVLLLGWLIMAFLVPMIIDIVKNKPVSVTVRSEKDTSIRLQGAVVRLTYNGQELTENADVNGVCNFVLVAPQSNIAKLSIEANDFISKDCDMYISSKDTMVFLTPVVKGIVITVKDEATGNIMPGAKVKLKFMQYQYEEVVGADGKVNFDKVPMDSTISLRVEVEADGYEPFTSSFYFEKEKVLLIPVKSADISDVPIDCGVTIKSHDDVRSVIQTINVKVPKGKLKIKYNMNSLPDELIIYKGKASQICDENKIFSTGFVKGAKIITVDYDTPDGIIAIRINGGDESTTEWEVHPYCPDEKKK